MCEYEKAWRHHLRKLGSDLIGHIAFWVLGAIIGLLLYAHTTFDAGTYMKRNEPIGPAFEAKLVLFRVDANDSNNPTCVFQAGSSSTQRGLTRGETDAVGDYRVDLMECVNNGAQSFAVLRVQRTTWFYRTMGSLWAFLRLR